MKFLDGVKKWGKDRAEDVKVFCTKHPEVAMTVGLSIFSGAGWLIKKAVNQHQINVENDKTDRNIWDPQLGKYHRLKHKMSLKESREYSRRMNNGESRFDILDDMDLLR